MYVVPRQAVGPAPRRAAARPHCPTQPARAGAPAGRSAARGRNRNTAPNNNENDHDHDDERGDGFDATHSTLNVCVWWEATDHQQNRSRRRRRLTPRRPTTRRTDAAFYHRHFNVANAADRLPPKVT